MEPFWNYGGYLGFFSMTVSSIFKERSPKALAFQLVDKFKHQTLNLSYTF